MALWMLVEEFVAGEGRGGVDVRTLVSAGVCARNVGNFFSMFMVVYVSPLARYLMFSTDRSWTSEAWAPLFSSNTRQVVKHQLHSFSN